MTFSAIAGAAAAIGAANALFALLFGTQDQGRRTA